MKTDSDLELDLEKIEQLGQLRERENFEFWTILKGQDGRRIDEIVHRLNAEISGRIDCTKCGNCCKKLEPCIRSPDIKRLSTKLGIPEEEIRANYLKEIEGEKFFKRLPCIFLKGNKCSIYQDRPDDCKSYPHLHKQDFISRLWGVIDNYSICPIVFNVFEKLKQEM